MQEALYQTLVNNQAGYTTEELVKECMNLGLQVRFEFYDQNQEGKAKHRVRYTPYAPVPQAMEKAPVQVLSEEHRSFGQQDKADWWQLFRCHYAPPAESPSDQDSVEEILFDVEVTATMARKTNIAAAMGMSHLDPDVRRTYARRPDAGHPVQSVTRDEQ